ncbi:MAG: hypothetical protein PHI68_08065, partial [Candidatus Cloacimonetes bacterium]|nr:hypothetical protein [Candidatus Cloacimonadota bacterium]
MIKVAIYTSNHGFGHATRMAALAEEFIRYGLLCHVRSNRPEFIFGNLNPHYHSLSDAGIDFGVRHNHNLVPEKELTRQDLLDLMDRRPELVAQDVRFLKEQEIDFVVA